MKKIKLFEEFKDDAYLYPGVVLNLKQSIKGDMLHYHPIFAVSNYDYESGNPPLINRIPRNERSPKEIECLRLQNYFENEMLNLIKIENSKKSIDLNGIIEYLQELGYEIRSKKWGNMIEHTLFFETKDEIDEFLKDLEKFIR